MKRSEINKALKELEAMCAKYKCYLPPFCNFTPEEGSISGIFKIKVVGMARKPAFPRGCTVPGRSPYFLPLKI